MNITEYIKQISSGGQMTLEEYDFIVNLTQQITPCNMLIFSMGKDSKLWNFVNKGRTVFIEDSLEWINKIKEPDMEWYNVKYDIPRYEWQARVQERDKKLLIDLPRDISETPWDIILVDGPLGGYDGTVNGNGPGRAQSIFTAYHLAKASTHVLIHDCKREIEKECGNMLFSERELVNIKNLNYFKP
tara:strand:+ start:2640 stop:3200 length:561 start_codon:yes stop_codon:yes gene_type:complete